MESETSTTLHSETSDAELKSPEQSSLDNGHPTPTTLDSSLSDVFVSPQHETHVTEPLGSSTPEQTIVAEKETDLPTTSSDSAWDPQVQSEAQGEVKEETVTEKDSEEQQKGNSEGVIHDNKPNVEVQTEGKDAETVGKTGEEDSPNVDESKETEKAADQAEAAEAVPVIKAVPYVSLPCSVSQAKPKNEEPPTQSLHHVKWIEWNETRTPIVTQNENGPCPLVAILNVLLLRGKVKLPPKVEVLTASKLMEYLGNAILENTPQNVSSEVQLNYEQNMHDAMAVLPKLQTGLDVNVKFTGVRDFEYTPECIIFDLLNINLYHGWLTDPESPEIQAAIGHVGYNQLVEKIITEKSSSNPAEVTEALIAESFLERTASQLTYHGLSELASTMPYGELAILFRNNHFSTIYKHKGEILQLATDQGFLSEPSIVWETLSNIEGDGEFVDARFCSVSPQSQSAKAAEPLQQVDQDYLVALSLQQEQLQTPEVEPREITKSQQELNDEFLARQLEEEDRRRASLERQAQGPSGTQRSRERAPKKESCTVL